MGNEDDVTHRPWAVASVSWFVALTFTSAAAAQVNFGAATDFAVGMTPVAVAVGDFNGDSDPDLAVANFGSADVSILLGGAGGDFGPASNFATGSNPISVAVGDFNGDSHSDLAVARSGVSSFNVMVRLGGAGGSFGPASFYEAGDNSRAVAVADVNGD